MGNAESPATESAPRLPTTRAIAHALILRRRSSLKPRSASFLEAPVVHKATECGEAAVTVKGERNNKAGDAHKLWYAVSEMQGWRSHMEDEHLLNPPLTLPDHHLFAVFDGHGGAYASAFCSEHFVATLTEQREWRNYGDRAPASRGTVAGLALLKAALAATFLALDTKLRAARRALPGTTFPGNMTVPPERSGSTGVVVLVTPSHVLCANAGDSRALLARRPSPTNAKGPGAVLPLSFDHKPNNDVEVARVERDGGFVKARRVDGVLAVSRGFGDFDYKHNAGDEAWGATASVKDRSRDHRITVHPDILVHPRDPALDDFVVLACDGIWDCLTNRDCASLVRTLREAAGEGGNCGTAAAGQVVEAVLDAALARGSLDNMTCCLVLFPQGGKTTRAITAPLGVNAVTKWTHESKAPAPSHSTPAVTQSPTPLPTIKPIPSQPLESVPQPGLPSSDTPGSATCARLLPTRQDGEASGPAPQPTANPGHAAATPPPLQCKKHKAAHVLPAATKKIGRARDFKSLRAKCSRVRPKQ